MRRFVTKCPKPVSLCFDVIFAFYINRISSEMCDNLLSLPRAAILKNFKISMVGAEMPKFLAVLQ